MTDRPLFRSLDSALRFTYQTAPRVIGISAIAGLMAADKREGAMTREEELDAPPPRAINFDLDPVPIGIDAAAQQGLIKGFVARRSSPGRLHLLAKYAKGDERRQAQRELRDYLLTHLEDDFRPHYVVYACVSLYYGRRNVRIKDLAARVVHLIPNKEGQLPANRLRECERKCRTLSILVSGLLKDVGARAEDVATQELRVRGVIA